MTSLQSYRICSRCIMDTSDPEIIFTATGCNHCDQAARMLREIETLHFLKLFKKIPKGKKYDVLIGLSGGVDSSYALDKLVGMGFRPLCFSIDNGWNNPATDENIMRMVETLKVPFYRYVVDLSEFQDLQIAFLKSGTANIEIPTDHILMAASYEIAEKYGIKTIISGGNVSTESIMPKAWGYEPKDLRFIKAVFRKYTGRNLRSLPTITLAKYLYLRFLKKTNIINLLDYLEYNRADAKKVLAEKYGWKDYGEKHCENAFTQWFQIKYLPEKFGFDKRRAHYSSLIMSGQMKRDDALTLIQERQVYPDIISFNFMKVPKRSYRDFPNSEFAWNLLAKVYGFIKHATA